jgi:hypothetical protein
VRIGLTGWGATPEHIIAQAQCAASVVAAMGRHDLSAVDREDRTHHEARVGEPLGPTVQMKEPRMRWSADS